MTFCWKQVDQRWCHLVFKSSVHLLDVFVPSLLPYVLKPQFCVVTTTSDVISSARSSVNPLAAISGQENVDTTVSEQI